MPLFTYIKIEISDFLLVITKLVIILGEIFSDSISQIDSSTEIIVREGRIVPLQVTGENGFDKPRPLPQSRHEHLERQVGWNNEMVVLLNVRRQQLLTELAGINQQIRSINISSARLVQEQVLEGKPKL